MENKTVLEEILELKQAFENGGIYWAIYTSQKRVINARIDYEVEKRLKEYMSILLAHKIDKNQYLAYRNRLENTRRVYKRLLAKV